MKKNLLTGIGLILLFLVSFLTKAQNYQPFRKNLTYHYLAQDSIYSLRVDSVKVVAGDSVFVFNQMTRKTNATVNNPNCIPPNYYESYHLVNQNQFGKQVTKKQNGDYIFKNAQGAEFLLKTKVGIGQNWVFNTTNNINASLSFKIFGAVTIGLQDSILVYNLSNGSQIQLSKKYGFVSSMNFIAITDPGYRAKTLNFYKIPEKQIGAVVSSPLAVFNFQPGDKFMLHKRAYTDFSNVNLCSEEWNQTQVLTRRNSPNNDTIYYTIEKSRLYKAYGNAAAPAPFCNRAAGTTLYQPTTQTLIITANTSPETALLSHGFMTQSQNLPASGMVSKGIFRNPVFHQREQLLFHNVPFLTCAQSFTYMTDYARTVNYAVGLGKVYENVFSTNEQFTEQLIAYQKGSETYGTWQTMAQLMAAKEDLTQKPLIQAFPNPFTSELTFTFGETTGNTQLTLRNTLGQTVWEQVISAAANSELKVKLPELAKGLYILQASQKGKTFTSRLVKE